MNWKYKVLIQQICSKIPFGEHIYYLGQRTIGGLKDFNVNGKLKQGCRLLEIMFRNHQSFENKVAMEIGTGWIPCLPILFWYFGQTRCETYDIASHLKADLLNEALSQITAALNTDIERWRKYYPVGASLMRDRSDILDSLKQKNAQEILESLNIYYHPKTDICAIDDRVGFYDIIYSNTTLEHISVQVLRKMLNQCYKLLKPGGLMLHLVDTSDHYSHSDSSISPVHFLTFSQEEFVKINNRFCFQNRLRNMDYKKLFGETAFHILDWNATVNKRSMAALQTMKLNSEFKGLPEEEICSASIEILAQKK